MRTPVSSCYQGTFKKFTTGMATPAKQPVTSIKCDSFIKTRRMNKTESFLLEERLKVLDSKKSQKYAEFNVEKHTLQKQMEEIRSVRKNSGISVERRKLLRSQGYTIDARAAMNSSEDVPVAFKRFSVPEMGSVDSSASRSPKIGLNMHKSEPIMGAFSQINIHRAGETEKEIASEEQPNDPDAGITRSRARHQFRVIEPPSRPGSRRNFVQLSNDKLKEFKEKEDKESGETLFDPNLKLDHRGVILSPRLAKSLRNTTQADTVKGDELSSGSRLISLSDKQICQDKQNKTVIPTHSEQILFGANKQAWAENLCVEDKTSMEEKSSFPAVERKFVSKSCENLDRMTEVRASDNPSDCHESVSISRDVITPRSPYADPKSITNKVHSPLEPRRKQASTRPPARLAFIEPQDGTPNMDKQSFSVNHSREPRHKTMESRNSNLRDLSEPTEKTQAPRDKSAELQKKRRVTLPPGKFNFVPNKDVAPNHEGSKRESKKLSIASLSPNTRKKSMFSTQPERHSQDDTVTYAYDARPGRSLCKGYVTMQMTVKGKQVKVHIPKFPNDSESEPILSRLRKKVSIDRFQPKTLQDKEKSDEEEKSEA